LVHHSGIEAIPTSAEMSYSFIQGMNQRIAEELQNSLAPTAKISHELKHYKHSITHFHTLLSLFFPTRASYMHLRNQNKTDSSKF
jgi:hypothetical protein